MQKWKYTLLQVCIDLRFILPLSFSGCSDSSSVSLTPYLVTTFVCMRLVFSGTPSLFLSPPSYWTSLQLVPFCRALGSSLQKTKLPSRFQLRVFNTTSPHNCSPWKIQYVSLWRVAQDSWIFWRGFCPRCNCVYVCWLYTELKRQLQRTVATFKHQSYIMTFTCIN